MTTFATHHTDPLSLLGGPSQVTVTLGNREQNLLKGMSPKQVELVADLMANAETAELQKRAILEKSIEAAETIGAAGVMGFVEGYYPNFKPGGFDVALLAGMGAHIGAVYTEHTGITERSAEMLSYGPHLEHVGNGCLAAYAHNEFRELGQRMLAAKQAKAANAPAQAPASP